MNEHVKQWLFDRTVTIGQKGFFVDGRDTLDGRTRLLSAVYDLVSEGTYMLAFRKEAALSGSATYALALRERVAERLRQKLHEIERAQNKKYSRRYVHWSNGLGRYVDDGE